MSVRVRFAPSPTGYLHVGGLRTALYNYLFAKKHGGTFILRIEDTDRTRLVQGALENLVSTLTWSGLPFDEGPGVGGPHGPYIQSERTELYQRLGKELLENGHAYKCFCTSERLDDMRNYQQRMGQPPRYDKFCEHLSAAEIKEKEDAGLPYVVRMKVPERTIRFHDEIRGLIEIEPSNIDDQVLLKSDGFPTYHLANVIDDHDMEITHVIRGEEWLPSTPKHILLYEYFGWTPPKFAHLSLLLNSDRSKLSKRQGDVAVEDYKARGYEREALINFVAFLGWNPGSEKEIYTLQELGQEFDLDRVGKSGAIFNVDKLNWFNEQHLKLKTTVDLVNEITPLIENEFGKQPEEQIRNLVEMLKDRVRMKKDFIEMGRFFFQEPEQFGQNNLVSLNAEPNYIKMVPSIVDDLNLLNDFNTVAIQNQLSLTASNHNIKINQIMKPIRISISGMTNGPSLFETMSVLGKEKVIKRLENAISFINTTNK